jgi:hypothetical protein
MVATEKLYHGWRDGANFSDDGGCISILGRSENRIRRKGGGGKNDKEKVRERE